VDTIAAGGDLMTTTPGRYAEIFYAILRVISGLLFAQHGAQKLFGALGGHVTTGSPKMLIAGIIEFAGGVLLALGLLTRIAAVLAAGEMAVAYFTVHAPQGFWPVVNKGELAVAYCFLFLYMAAHGGGPYSLDALFARERRS
jgi:putative oxidoreductase